MASGRSIAYFAHRGHRRAEDRAQESFWEPYESLKQYRLKLTSEQRRTLEGLFDRLCVTKTGYPDLNTALGLLHAKRYEFLADLE